MVGEFSFCKRECGPLIFEYMNNRLHHFDGMRGIAALMVLLSHWVCTFHYHWYEGDDWFGAMPIRLLYDGELAVALFFVISGFVLSAGYFKHTDKQLVLLMFIKRYPRLMIPVWSAVAFSYLFFELEVYQFTAFRNMVESPWLNKLFTETISWQHTLKNIGYEFLLKHNFPTPINPVLWTLAIELKGSFLVFGILLLLPKNELRYIIYVVLAAWFYPSYYLLFIAGVAMCDMHTNRLRQFQFSTSTISGLFLFAVVLTCLPHLKNTGEWPIKPTFIAAIIFVMMMVFNVNIQKLFRSKFPAQLGKISFSLYLFHLPLFFITVYPIYYWVMRTTHHTITAEMVALFIGVPLILLMVGGILNHVDRFAISFARKIQFIIQAKK